MTSIVRYSGLESDGKRADEKIPLMLLAWVLGGAAAGTAVGGFNWFGTVGVGAAVAVA